MMDKVLKLSNSEENSSFLGNTTTFCRKWKNAIMRKGSPILDPDTFFLTAVPVPQNL
jgi:hypothetical protein